MTRASRRQFGTLVLTLVLCSMPGQWVPEAAAQSPPEILSEIARFQVSAGTVVTVPAVGTRVRVTAPGALGESMRGDVLTVDEQTLTITSEHGERVSFEREFVTRLEVSMGQKRHLLAGLLIGAVGGVAAGLLAGDSCDLVLSRCYTRGELARNGGLFWGAFGAVGGWFWKSDKWVEMPLDQVRVGFGPTPPGHGRGVTLTVAF